MRFAYETSILYSSGHFSDELLHAYLKLGILCAFSWKIIMSISYVSKFNWQAVNRKWITSQICFKNHKNIVTEFVDIFYNAVCIGSTQNINRSVLHIEIIENGLIIKQDILQNSSNSLCSSNELCIIFSENMISRFVSFKPFSYVHDNTFSDEKIAWDVRNVSHFCKSDTLA